MYTVYILKSKIFDRYYIGHTKNLENRLKRHNSGYVRSTKAYRPWIVVCIEEFETKSEAYRREMQVKSYKRGNAFKSLLRDVNSNQLIVKS